MTGLVFHEIKFIHFGWVIKIHLFFWFNTHINHGMLGEKKQNEFFLLFGLTIIPILMTGKIPVFWFNTQVEIELIKSMEVENP